MRSTAILTLIASMALAPMHGRAVMAAGEGPAGVSGNGCSCPMTISAGRENPGKIIAVKGEVLISGENGFGPAQGGAQVPVGSQLMTGGNGSAVLAFGQACRIGIASNSSARVARTANRGVCVNVLDRTATAAVGNAYDGDRLATNAILGGTLLSGLMAVGVGHNQAASH